MDEDLETTPEEDPEVEGHSMAISANFAVDLTGGAVPKVSDPTRPTTDGVTSDPTKPPVR